LVDHACFVFLTSRSLARGREAIESMKLDEACRSRCELIELDTSKDASIAAAVVAVKAKLGDEKLYGIVNNAGTGLAHNVSPEDVVNVNYHGVKRVVDNFMPLLQQEGGRIVNVGSGSGPSYVKNLGQTDLAKELIYPDTIESIEKHLQANFKGKYDTNGGYGISKACLAAYTIVLAKMFPTLWVSCCSPGFINTKIVGNFGATKPPEEGTVAIKHCLLNQLEGNGWYYGSDAKRSPYHFMRNPGEPVYNGELPF